MKPFIFLSAVLIVTQARPESFGGYNYPAPAGEGLNFDNGYTSGSSTSSLFSSGSHFNGNGGTIIRKHIYVHVPPPEPEEEQTYHAPVYAPKKTYKIIFIKAPSAQPAYVAPSVISQASQEKTIVYVLVKKPEDPSEIIQQTPPAPSSKPEVYFIRYKTRKGANNGPSLGDPSLTDPSLSGSSGHSSFLNGNGPFSGSSSNRKPSSVYGV